MKKINSTEIDFNADFKSAYDAMSIGIDPILITGRAGTGKSTLLRYFLSNTIVNCVVTAPTGIAAVNVGGCTIHSFCKFRPPFDNLKIEIEKNPIRKKVYEKMEALIIDEISMASPYLIDQVDLFLRMNRDAGNTPFGGVKIIMLGDLFQLSPIDKPKQTLPGDQLRFDRNIYDSNYFFSAKIWEEYPFKVFNLEKIYRQSDPIFISLLEAIRRKKITYDVLDHINQRFDPSFEPAINDSFITLTSTNAIADKINEEKYNSLNRKEYIFPAEVTGVFNEKNYPTNFDLKLKEGTQVMFLRNNPPHWYNGTIGVVVGFEVVVENARSETFVLVDVETNGTTNTLQVGKISWENMDYRVDNNNNWIPTPIGTFSQYPLKYAWAVTIHKSQGQTFEKVVIDLGRGAFAHGQTYVALSRCKTLQGIVLRNQLRASDIILDRGVEEFMQRYN